MGRKTSADHPQRAETHGQRMRRKPTYSTSSSLGLDSGSSLTGACEPAGRSAPYSEAAAPYMMGHRSGADRPNASRRPAR